jgi:hypothetical protein
MIKKVNKNKCCKAAFSQNFHKKASLEASECRAAEGVKSSKSPKTALLRGF